MITRQDRLNQLSELRNPEQRMARILADRTIAKAILKLGTLIGSDGQDGKTPIKGKDYFTQEEINSVRDYIKSQVVKNGRDGIDGRSIKGESGKDGINGRDGYSPVRGIDYWTDTDKVKILAYIDKMMPKAPTVDSVVAKVKGSLEAKDIKGLPDLKDLPSLIAYLKMGGFRGGGSSGGGTGTVTSTSVVTANGVSGSVATATTTPAITLVLGAITPSSVAATGTVTGSNLSGTNTGDQDLSTYPTLTSTSTLTNKRIPRRVLSLSANSATPAINTDNYDVVHITAQTTAITSFTTNLTGTPVDGDTLRISITGTGAVGITWGTKFESSTVILPTTTVTTARLDIGFFWNTETSKWRCTATS